MIINQSTKSLIKEFFYLKRSKLVAFLLLSMLFLYFAGQQDMVLGNITWTTMLFATALIYLFVSILWFSFKSRKHFVIGLIVFLIIFATLRFLDAYSSEKRAAVERDCMKSTSSESRTVEVVRCMSEKGYEFYR